MFALFAKNIQSNTTAALADTPLDDPVSGVKEIKCVGQK